MSDNLNVEMTERQLSTIISGLLFSCSVNIVSETSKEYQRELYELAKLLLTIKPDIKLESVQFLEEENYEDEFSKDILTTFEGNIEVVEMIKE